MPSRVRRCIVVVSLLLGCDGCHTNDGGSVTAAVSPSGAGHERESRGSKETADAADDRSRDDEPKFTWSRTPKLDAIPDGPVRGALGGEPLEIRTVLFQHRARQWALIAAEHALPREQALLPGNSRFVRIAGLPPSLEAGTFDKPKLAPGDGHLQLPVPSAPGQYRSWAGVNAYVLQITKWDVAPYEAAGPLIQVVGRASGRVAVVYEADDEAGYGRAWVAGRFDDVPVRHLGPPQ